MAQTPPPPEEPAQSTPSCTVRNLSGEVLAELPFGAESSAGQLAQELALLRPLIKPHTMRYALVLCSVRLPPDGAVWPHAVDGALELIAVVEMLPWCISSELAAKTPNVLLVASEGGEALSARRSGGNGGTVASERAVPWLEGHGAGAGTGAFSFEVVVDGMEGDENEGVEVGVTTTPPGDIVPLNYAVLNNPSWVSSDAGTLWVDCHGDHYGSVPGDHKHWRTTRPSKLVVGDVVQFSVLAGGQVEVKVNGDVQAFWEKAGVDTDKPLFALVGMRAPCCAVTLRLPGQ